MRWVDDRPHHVHREVAMLERLGMRVMEALGTEEALERLQGGLFDLVISDVARGEDPEAGLRALPHLRDRAPGVPVAFYVGQRDPK